METSKTTFYIVRHGETQWNVKKLYQGHKDSPLTPQGIEQVKALAQELHSTHFDHVFSSDLARAQRTAELLTMERTLAVNTTHLLRERSFGTYEGRSREEFEEENKEIVERYKKLSKAEQWKFKFAPDMESNEEVIGRLLTFLREVAVTYPGTNVLVVAHGGILRVLLRHLGYMVKDGRGMVGNAAYAKIASDGIEFEVQELKGITLEEG